ncbi:MAG: permease [Beijerinckiaceae bacterium]
MKLKQPIFDWTFNLVAALSIGAAIVVWRNTGWAGVAAVFHEDLILFATILPKVAAGCVIGAMVRLLVPREIIVRWVGEGSGLKGILIASAVGAIFPGGPFTIFPLAVGFMMSGADRGAAVAFITGWLVLGINRAIIWELPFFGADIVLFRHLISLPFPVLAGLAARALGRFFPVRPKAEA